MTPTMRWAGCCSTCWRWSRRACIRAAVHIIEADLIRLRTKEGMRDAKAKGRLRGRRPKLNARQEAHLVSLIAAGQHSTAEVADLFGVSRPTVYRALQRDRSATTA